MKASTLCVTALALLALGTPAAMRSASDPVPQGSLLGERMEAVLERFGIPDQFYMGSGGYVMFQYTGAGTSVGRFSFSNGVAFDAPPVTFRPRELRPISKKRVYPGQPVAEAVRILGAPKEILQGTQAVEARYENGAVVAVMDGRVYPR